MNNKQTTDEKIQSLMINKIHDDLLKIDKDYLKDEVSQESAIEKFRKNIDMAMSK